jgi:hypothetical protein
MPVTAHVPTQREIDEAEARLGDADASVDSLCSRSQVSSAR